MDANGTKSIDPDIAISDKGNVHVVWRDQHVDTQKNEIMFRTSIDNGTNFAFQIILENKTNFGTGVTDPGPQVATSGDYVYVVWHNQTDIVVAASANNGTSFSTAVNVANDIPNVNSVDRALPASGGHLDRGAGSLARRALERGADSPLRARRPAVSALPNMGEIPATPNTEQPKMA